MTATGNATATTTDSSSTRFIENTALCTRLKQCTNLPSPPGVAARIIELGQEPDASMAEVAEVVSMDPAISAKLLRMANSAIYARQRKTENLRQAIMLFGLNGTLTMALSFSLANTAKPDGSGGMDYDLYWRRSLTAAVASQIIGAHLKIGSKEDLFMPALLQDIGMMALDRVMPELYAELGDQQANHEFVCETERKAIGDDHAAVSAWLLEHWGLPQHILSAVAGSHDPSVQAVDPEHARLASCVAVSSRIADIWWGNDPDRASARAALMAQDLLDLDQETLTELLQTIAAEQRETASMFDVELGDPLVMDSILDQAKEILMIRNLQTMQEAAVLQQTTETLESRTRELEESSRRDGLTGVFNRAFLDQTIEEEFSTAQAQGWPLTLAFVDLDHFKQVNDTHGHQSGDDVLRETGRLLTAATRDTDFVGRYGGEEFVIVLPGTSAEGAGVTCERLVESFRNAQHTVTGDAVIKVTASVGVATMDKDHPYPSVEAFLEAADKSVYAAKSGGRDRCVYAGS